MELRHLTLSRLSAARGRTHLFADQAAVAARMVPLSSIVASDVADAVTRPWAISLGVPGMLAEPATAVRLVGGRISEAIRIVWLALILFLATIAALTLTSRLVGQSGAACERQHEQNRQHNNTNASQGVP